MFQGTHELEEELKEAGEKFRTAQNEATQNFHTAQKEAEQNFHNAQNRANEGFLEIQRQIINKWLTQPSPQPTDMSGALSEQLYRPALLPQRDQTYQLLNQQEEHDDIERRSVDFFGDNPNQAENGVQKWLHSVINDHKFEVVTAASVIFYNILIGIDVHMDMTETLGTKSNIAEPIVNMIMPAFILLVCAYFIEVCMRFGADPHAFFHDPDLKWFNIVDAIILPMCIVDLIVGCRNNEIELLSEFRVLRVLRFLRTFRIIRFFQYLPDLRMMLCSVLSCMRSFLWAMLLMFITFYIFVIFLEDSAIEILVTMRKQQSLSADGDLAARLDKITEGLRKHWDGMYEGMLSLIFSISGGDDWADIGKPFFDISVIYGCIFTGVIFVSLFGILNVLIGLFVRKAGAIENWDSDLACRDAYLNHKAKSKMLEKLFQEIDNNGSGEISLDELKKCLRGRSKKDQRILNYFRHLGIEIDSTAEEIVHAFDKDGDGLLNLGEFVEGCRKLQGNAMPMRLEKLATKIDKILLDNSRFG